MNDVKYFLGMSFVTAETKLSTKVMASTSRGSSSQRSIDSSDWSRYCKQPHKPEVSMCCTSVAFELLQLVFNSLSLCEDGIVLSRRANASMIDVSSASLREVFDFPKVFLAYELTGNGAAAAVSIYTMQTMSPIPMYGKVAFNSQHTDQRRQEGGDVRGLSSILTLRVIMDRFNRERKPENRREPWQIIRFDGGNQYRRVIVTSAPRLLAQQSSRTNAL